MKATGPTPIPNSKPMKVTKPFLDLQEQIRHHAHELDEKRGKDDGHELDDWLQAESELSQQRAKGVTA
jgi:DUF2934 family protein